jgi:hypothetical protein
MKIRITVTDDKGKEFGGTFDLPFKGSFSKGKIEATPQPTKSNNYKGLVGGITLLIDNGFFISPKTANEVHAELKKETYYYSIQSVDSSLRKDFVSRKKILTRIQEGKVWKYVLRK